MLNKRGCRAVLIVLSCAIPGARAETSVTVELAKQCAALAEKAYPPLVIGNPAAGVKGDGKAKQQYYQRCIKNQGSVDQQKNNNQK